MTRSPAPALLISHESALEYWRLPGSREGLASLREHSLIRNPVRADRSKNLPELVEKLRKSRHSPLRYLSSPIRLTVADPRERHTTSQILTHEYAGAMPSGSFMALDAGVWVATPELCLLQMARTLKTAQLSALMMEFFGTYSLPANPSCETSYSLPRLSGPKRLSGYLERAAGSRGLGSLGQVRRALRYAPEGAASPMETNLVLLLCLPYVLGGYNLPFPLLNEPVEVVGPARELTSSKALRCDLRWPEAAFALEYDSREYHEGMQPTVRDAERRNALAAMGIEVVPVYRPQANDLVRLDTLARHVARRIGRRLRTPRDHSHQTAALREQLCLPVRTYAAADLSTWELGA